MDCELHSLLNYGILSLRFEKTKHAHTSGLSQLYVIDVVSIVYEINTEIYQYHIIVYSDFLYQ